MYCSNFPRSKKELILLKPIKKSNYLKSLEKQRYKGLQFIEKEKAGLLIDKILRKETIFRDYSIFSKHKNDNNINENFYTLENHKRKNKNLNNYYFNKNMNNGKNNKINNSSKKNKEINNISKETFITGNIDKKNFLSIIGDDIINTKLLFKDMKKFEKQKK